MKKVILVTVLCLVCVGLVSADVYVTVDTASRRIVSMSQKDDSVVAEGQEIVVKPGDIKGYNLEYNPVFYDMVDGVLDLNEERLESAKKKEKEFIEKQKEIELINEKIRDLAIQQLTDEGVDLKHFKKKGE